MSGVSDDSEIAITSPVESSDTKNSVASQSGVNKRKSSFNKQNPKKYLRSTDYHPGYHRLYNDNVDETKSPVKAEERAQWSSSRVGLCYWSSYEKEKFFIALDRKGQDNIKGISSFVGTKSELEVRAFVLALQDGLAEEGPFARPLSEIPSAFEISQECDLALDVASVALAQRQLDVEEAIERQRHGEWWLIDYDTAVMLKDFLDKNQLHSSYQDIEAAAKLFDVPLMTKLSARVFMNSKNPEGNWTTWAEDDSSPGLYGTALVDFYNLVVGITKRVISSSIFLAKSRHSLQFETLGRTTDCKIQIRDIQAACKMLGLKKDRKTDWVKVARRCNLDVYKRHVFQRTRQWPLSYDEVEQELAAVGRVQYARPKDRPAVASDSNITTISDIAMVHDGTYLAEEAEDERAELLDTIASKEEEHHLWKIIDQDTPELTIVKDEEQVALPRASHDPDRVAKDWRKTTRYRSPWQSIAGVPSEELFNERAIVQSKARERTAVSSSDNGTASSLSSSGGVLSDGDGTTSEISYDELSST